MILAAALVSITLGVSLPPATVVQGPCPDASAPSACTDAGTIYAPANADEFAVAHEYGHLMPLTVAQQQHLQRLLGLPAETPWKADGATGLQGLTAPSERFADAFAACRLRLDPEGQWETGYDYLPTRRQHARVCAAIRRYS